MVTPLYPFGETEARKERSQITETNISVCGTLDNPPINRFGHPTIMQDAAFLWPLLVVPERCVGETSSHLAFFPLSPYLQSSMQPDRSTLEALGNIIEQGELLISTTVPLPENRTPRCQELLRAASALVDDLLKQAA